jgi:hypothetical protein
MGRADAAFLPLSVRHKPWFSEWRHHCEVKTYSVEKIFDPRGLVFSH